MLESPFLTAKRKIFEFFEMVSFIQFNSIGDKVLNSFSLLEIFFKSITLVSTSFGSLHFTLSNSTISPSLYLFRVSILRNESPMTIRIFFLLAKISAKNLKSIKGFDNVFHPFSFYLSIIIVPKSFLGKNSHWAVAIISIGWVVFKAPCHFFFNSFLFNSL